MTKIPAGFSALNQSAIEYLQGKYGQDVQLSSTTAALKAVIDLVERESLVLSDDTGYCRQSFDRTSPGYSKSYDKCSDRLFAEEISAKKPESDATG
jgi:predicted lipoprotein with Yx(FWY)xxD motif